MILLLCAGRFLSAYDLAELFGRYRLGLVHSHLMPMLRSGELETKFPKNKSCSGYNHPHQAYRTVADAGRGSTAIIPGLQVEENEHFTSSSL